jgi:uncharacterized protein
LDRARKFHVLRCVPVTLAPGRIVFITGQSGSGKSTLLRILRRHVRPHVDLGRIRLRPRRLLPEQFHRPLDDALRYLSIAGLADAYLFLRTPEELSDGQRHRLRLALALSRRAAVVFADEFLGNLDRVTARILAHNVRRYADRFDTAFVLASTRDDVIDALRPDVLILKGLADHCEVRPDFRASCA